MYKLICLITLIGVIAIGSPVFASSLYCSIPSGAKVDHFDVNLHSTIDVETGGTSQSTFNYLTIKNFIKIGPSQTRTGYTEYKVMDVSFLDEILTYRIIVLYSDKTINQWWHSSPSEPFYTGQQQAPNKVKDLIIKIK